MTHNNHGVLVETVSGYVAEKLLMLSPHAELNNWAPPATAEPLPFLERARWLCLLTPHVLQSLVGHQAFMARVLGDAECSTVDFILNKTFQNNQQEGFFPLHHLGFYSSSQRTQDTGWTKTRCCGNIRNAVNREIEDSRLCEDGWLCLFVAWVWTGMLKYPACASGGGSESPGRVFEIKK